MTVCTNPKCDSMEFKPVDARTIACVKCGTPQKKRARATHDSYPLGTAASMVKKEPRV